MNAQEYLLTALSEELIESAHRVSKALRFGLTEVQPGQSLNNSQRIDLEINDIYAVLDILEERGINLGSYNPALVEAKKAKVRKYMEYSREAGALQ